MSSSSITRYMKGGRASVVYLVDFRVRVESSAKPEEIARLLRVVLESYDADVIQMGAPQPVTAGPLRRLPSAPGCWDVTLPID